MTSIGRCAFLWMSTFFRQKNIVCSSELDEHLLIQCGAPAMLRPRLTFVGEEHKVWVGILFCSLKECGACTANSLHDGHVDART